jgi:endonuclease/exonuclease/phosphatase family metal-dependent hydrolase
MRIVAWNLAHQTRERPTPPGLLWAVEKLHPDILTLNEYVHGKSRAAFLKGLKDLGLLHVAVSQRVDQNNQILIASRYPVRVGDLPPPGMGDGISESNFLHVSLARPHIEIVGVRVPAYRTRADLHSYWTKFAALVLSASNRHLAFIGDLNADPTSKRHVGTAYLERLCRAGWNLPSPQGDWSFASGSRLDHLLASPSLGCSAAQYVRAIDGVPLASKPIGDAVSDHAPLVVDLSP